MNDERFDDEDNDQENFAELLEQSLGLTRELTPGEQIEATVLQIGSEWVFLDVGQKGEGVLDARELLDNDGQTSVDVGDLLNVYFLSRTGGELRFTTRIGGAGSGTTQIEEAWRSGIPVEGRIEKEIKGGYEIKLAGTVRAFCPFSQVGLGRQAAEEIIGESRSFKVVRFSEGGRNIVVSRREILEEERRRQREALRETLKEGMVVTGAITGIRDFGAFVDIGGLEGLLPISEISYGRIEDIHAVLQVGQQLELALKSCDWEKERFSFSLRDTLANPWGKVGSSYLVGQSYTGTVARLAPFGAFVSLEEGIDGLIPIARLGDGRRLRHAREALKVGQQLRVTIEKIDIEQRRISLAPADGTTEDLPSSYEERPAGGLGTLGDLLKAGPTKKRRR